MQTAEGVKLNLGCGYDIKEGYVNVDLHNEKAEVRADVRELPFAANVADEVVLHHVIEHIPWRYTIDVLEECHRVLKPGGVFILGYPEFEECVKHFLANTDGRRWSWWQQTLFGSQEHPGQFHCAAIMTSRLIEQLEEVGFEEFEHAIDGDHCSSLRCRKTNPRPWF